MTESARRRKRYANDTNRCASKARERSRKYRETDPDGYNAAQRSFSVKLSVRFSRAKANAKSRGIAFRLTRTEFDSNAKSACFYCGREPVGSETGSWADRVNPDRSVGYVASNIVPCCGPCNAARGSYFTHEEFALLSPTLRQIREARG